MTTIYPPHLHAWAIALYAHANGEAINPRVAGDETSRWPPYLEVQSENPFRLATSVFQQMFPDEDLAFSPHFKVHLRLGRIDVGDPGGEAGGVVIYESPRPDEPANP